MIGTRSRITESRARCRSPGTGRAPVASSMDCERRLHSPATPRLLRAAQPLGPLLNILLSPSVTAQTTATMRFGIFYEHQLPRPWAPGNEHRLLTDALEQVELADRLGIDYLWLVEHHFLEDYSHSSAPEVFLAAASQRTSRVRLGHGIVQLPPAYNHPARVAERIATLDLLSDGRVEFGTGESSSEAELGGFGIAREDKRAQWGEALEVVTRMLVEEPFAGHQGKFIEVPPRNVVPKPLQRPHPPLWVA